MLYRQELYLDVEIVYSCFDFSVHPFEMIVHRPVPWLSCHPDFTANKNKKGRSGAGLILSSDFLFRICFAAKSEMETLGYHVF